MIGPSVGRKSNALLSAGSSGLLDSSLIMRYVLLRNFTPSSPFCGFTMMPRQPFPARLCLRWRSGSYAPSFPSFAFEEAISSNSKLQRGIERPAVINRGRADEGECRRIGYFSSPRGVVGSYGTCRGYERA